MGEEGGGSIVSKKAFDRSIILYSDEEMLKLRLKNLQSGFHLCNGKQCHGKDSALSSYPLVHKTTLT